MPEPSSAFALPVRTGQILEGKFRIERIIGEGAMGLVVEATHLDLEEHVALKFLHREAAARPDIVARFAREARAAAKITSDHVARVYDVGWTDDGAPFIVMEMLDGMDLELVLAKSGPIDVTGAVEHVIQACEGLTAAHALGIVHRDIKPANLFRVHRAGTPQVKLLDFGISKAGISGGFDDARLLSADTTQIMGSPQYMSPEQLRSTKDVDARADIWSLGIVLYELVSGEMPFTATEVTALIAQVLHEPHRPVRALLPNVPDGLEEIIDRCLEKDPAKRYQSAADLAVALLPFAPKRARSIVERATAMKARAGGHVDRIDSFPPPPTSSPTITKTIPKSSGAPPLSIAVPSSPPEPARRPLVWAALACIILGLTGGVLALVMRLRTSSTDGSLASTTPAASAPAIAPPAEETVPPPSAAAPTTSPARVALGATATTPKIVLAPPALSASSKGARPVRAAASARPPGSSSSEPQPETEIRHER